MPTCEDQFQFPRLLNDKILCLVLVAERMTANHDRARPAWDETWNVRAQNWFAEHGSAQDVANRSVRTQPHLLQLELLHSLLIGRDCGAFDAHVVLENGVRRIDGDLIVGLVAMR